MTRRIVDASLRPLQRRLSPPLLTARGPLEERSGLLLSLRDEEGRLGHGEATPLPSHGTETLEECERALSRIAAEPGAWTVPDEPAPVGTLGDLPAAAGPAARFALECALHDLGAQAAGLPLARWLDRGAADAVTVNALLRAESPAALAEEAAGRVADGFGALKLKVGATEVARDVERVAAVRRAVGERVALRLDANAGPTGETASALLEAVAPFRPEYVEEPLAGADPDRLAQLRRSAPVPIAADESAGDERAVSNLLAADAVDVLVLKPLTLGGLLPARRLAETAAQVGVGVVVSGALDGSVATWAGLHLAASLAEPRRPAGLATAHWLADDAFPAPPIEKGAVALGPAAGLGLGEPA